MWNLNPADLLQLKGAGGERFGHFMDRLLRAEASCGGLAQSEIATQLRVNIPDGGIDAEVKRAIPRDKTGWFAVPTCWQYTTTETKNLQKEIHKPYAEKLIKDGYGYRLCLLGDLPPVTVQDWEAQLKVEVRAINPQAPDPRVVHGGYMLEWTERFPGVVAWLRNSPQGVFHWEAWAENRRAVTPHYVRNGDWDGVRGQILDHVQFDRPCIGGDPCLFIGGAAGVGKTRLVFESLAELLQSPALVLIVEDEQEARRIGTWLANADQQFAILVADECSPQARYFLNENLRGHSHRVRVVSIDNTGEPLASAVGRVLLSPVDALKNAAAILAANFLPVPEDRRRQYAELSRGFIRLAADMCEHDAEIAAGNLTGLLGSVERYARHRLGVHLGIIAPLALFHKVGFRDDVAGELEVLCQLTGYSKQQFHEAVRAIRESPGFVVQAGRYWYVTPEIVGRILFNEAWQRWVTPDLTGFFKRLPEEMHQQLVARVATHGREEVRDEVRTFFREWFGQLSALDLADSHKTALAAALVETSPEDFLPQLRSAIETARPGQLQQVRGYAPGGGWGSRRTLVWLYERLVSFPEYFVDCEVSLFRLALEESEPQIGNNATAIWANLFSVHLSGTATPFDRRLPILRRRTGSSIVPEARLGFAALEKALEVAMPKLVARQPGVAGRLRPEDWQPATRGEERACYRAALDLCGERLISGFHDEHHRLAFQVLVESLPQLLHSGLADDLRRLVTPQSLTEEEARKLLQTVDHFLEHEQISGHAQVNELVVAYLANVREWSNLFRPTDFIGRLRSVCARSPWDERFARDISKDKDEVDDLAASIVRQPALLADQLDWLASPEAQSAERLGFALGRIDVTGNCGRMIFEHAIIHKAAPLLRGCIRGLVYAQRPPGEDLLALMARLESQHPELALDLLGYAGNNFHAFDRILRLVDSQCVSPRYLAPLAMGLGGRELTADEVSCLLPYFTKAAVSGEVETALAGVRFLETYLLFESRHSAQTCLASAATQSLAWQLVESVLPFLTGHSGAEWIEILNKLAGFDSDRAARLLSQALLVGKIGFRKEAERELGQLARTRPESVMNGFGSALLDPERGWGLQIDICRDLIARIPAETVLAWVREHGMEAARAIARHLPLFHLDEQRLPIVPKVLDTILREFDDDEVFDNFRAGAQSGEVWWSNGGDQFRQAAEFANKFLNHPNRRIREWAKHEINYRQRLAEREDQEHEERVLRG